MVASQLNDTFTPQDTEHASSDLIYDGLRVQLEPAPFWPRALALCIDFAMLYLLMIGVVGVAALIVVIMVLGLGYTAGLAELESNPLGSIMLMLGVVALLLSMIGVTHGYFIYYEYKKSGQTPGKKLMGLRVVTLDGNPLSLGKCVMRETMRYIDTMLVLPGLLSFLLTQKRQRLGDIMSGTMVSYSRYDSQERTYTYVKQSDYLYLLEALNPKPVPEDQMRAFLAFAYKEFILSKQNREHDPSAFESWEHTARQYLPPSESEQLDQLTVLLFFAEYCQQTMNQIP